MYRFLLLLCCFFLTTAFIPSRCGNSSCGHFAHVGDEINISFPLAPLAKGSLLLTSSTNEQRFCDWTEEQHAEARELIQRISYTWQKNQMGRDYLVFGKTNIYNPFEIFQWEVVPFKEDDWSLWERTKVMWRIAFGAEKMSFRTLDRIQDDQSPLLGDFSIHYPLMPLEKEHPLCDDPFCNSHVIDQQLVFEGKSIYLLYDHKPASILGYQEKPHFLLIPKKHRQDFSDLTREEYCETMHLAKQIANYFYENTPYNTLYLYHKNGPLAGQSVFHWHLHIVAYDERHHNPVNNENKIVKSTVRQTGLLSPFHRIGNYLVNGYDSSALFLYITLPDPILPETTIAERVAHYKEELQQYLEPKD